MKAVARSLVVILVALISVPALVVSVTITSAIQLLATTALIMGGTQHPLSPDVDGNDFVNGYFDQAVGHFIVPGSNPAAPIHTYAVIYPAQFAPVFGTTTFDDSVDAGVSNLGACLGATGGICTVNHNAGVDSPAGDPPAPADTHFVVFGYSQSAVVASLVKNQLINDTTPDPALNGTEFYLISNPMRPNGGILGRGFQGTTIPVIGITFYGPTENSCGGPTCSPTDTTVYPTVDVAQQYDFLGGDAPARPLNLLAMANSLAAYAQLHGNVPTHQIGEDGMIDQGAYGDTQYYLISSPRLPILLPLQSAGVPSAALALPDAILRVWIEDGYVRDVSPGENVQFQWSPIGDPIGLIGNTLGAIPVGIDDTVQQATGTDTRPLGTANVYRPFGVGGQAYSKTTGLPVDDNVVPFSGVNNPLTLKPQQTNSTNLINNQQAGKQGNVTPESGSVPDTTKPDLFPKLRESLKFDPPKPPTGLRPNGDGPLKKIINKLTGQPDTDSSGESKAPAA